VNSEYLDIMSLTGQTHNQLHRAPNKAQAKNISSVLTRARHRVKMVEAFESPRTPR
jgi:hypothetical protein